MSEPSPDASDRTAVHGPESFGSPDDGTPNALATWADGDQGESGSWLVRIDWGADCSASAGR